MHCNLDLQKERLISLKEAPKHLPKRNGKRAHYSTIFRWANKGARGRVLESILVGGVRYTSVEALRRFTSEEVVIPKLNVADAIAQALASDGV